MWIPHTGCSAIRKEDSSTAQVPDRLTVLYLHHLGAHVLAFLMEIFNLSVARIDKMIHRSRVLTLSQLSQIAHCVPLRQEGIMSCLYQQHHSPSRQVHAGGPTGFLISPILFNHFVSDCPIPDIDMTSYTDNFTLLASVPASQHRGDRGEAQSINFVPYW